MTQLIYHLFNKNGGGFKTHVTLSIELFVTIVHGFRAVGVVTKSYLVELFPEKDIVKIMLHKWKTITVYILQLIILRGYKIKTNFYPLLNILEKMEIGKNGILFLQQKHSTTSDEGKWKNEFNGPVFYSHGTSNACGVLITFFGNNKKCVNSQLTDKHRWILILDVTKDGSEYILVNFYNANTESEQLKILNNLSELMKKVNITQGKQIVLAGDFNLFFWQSFRSYGRQTNPKKKTCCKNVVELKEEYNL